MKIYTKKGDKGFALSPEGLKSKDSLIFEVLGRVDEVQSLLGVVFEQTANKEIKEVLLKLLNIKYEVLSALYLQKDLKEDYSLYLESLIDELDLKLNPINKFILPIGSVEAASTHHARVVTRRLERLFVKWSSEENKEYENIAKYLNRLSDYLFMLARFLGEN